MHAQIYGLLVRPHLGHDEWLKLHGNTVAHG